MYDGAVLKGTRDVILKKLQPVSVHGQISWDVSFVGLEEPDGPLSVARVGGEAIAPNLEPGDLIELEYVAGQVVRVSPSRAVKSQV
jgi:hypothetical protein